MDQESEVGAEAVAVLDRPSENTSGTRKQVPGARGYGTLTPFDSESGRRARLMAIEKQAAAVRRGVAEAGKQVDTIRRGSALAVVQEIAMNQALNALDPSARGSQASAKLILDYGWPRPERSSEVSAAVPPGGASLSLSPELARELLTALRERRQRGSADAASPTE